MNDSAEFKAQIAEAEQELGAAQGKLLALRRQAQEVDVTDYLFQGLDGEPVPIGDLFGEKTELILIHNMGSGCPYCTLWADGLNSLTPYLEDRAGFALMSADPPPTAKAFAQSRGWRFRCVSWDGNAFKDDPEMVDPTHGIQPGVSTLRRDADGHVFHVAWAIFGPGDLYCALWHLFALLPLGYANWEPRYLK